MFKSIEATREEKEELKEGKKNFMNQALELFKIYKLTREKEKKVGLLININKKTKSYKNKRNALK